MAALVNRYGKYLAGGDSGEHRAALLVAAGTVDQLGRQYAGAERRRQREIAAQRLHRRAQAEVAKTEAAVLLGQRQRSCAELGELLPELDVKAGHPRSVAPAAQR